MKLVEAGPVRDSLKEQVKELNQDVKDIISEIVLHPDIIPRRVRTGSHVNEIIQGIGDHLLRRRLTRVRKSPVWSVMIDESADVANLEQLAINVLIVENGAKVSLFLGIVNLKTQIAAAIVSVLLTFFRNCKLDLEVMVRL